MRRNYKLILSIVVVLLAGAFAFSQEKEVEYRDVVLDGKPAKLNIATGEITFVNPKDKKAPVKFDDFVAAKEKDSLQTSNKDEIAGLHVVQEGETLFDISKYYNVSLTKLKKANNLETTLISKGQVLRVKNFDAAIPDNTNTESETTYNNAENKSGYHNVSKGETLFRLAKAYGLSLEELKRLNNLSSNIITVGQTLRVKENPVSAANLNQTNTSDSIWVVSKGDTLFGISKKNGISVDELKRLNGLTENTIYVGQKLRLN
ncbi:LysM peptidoglycan-binding domain-containing protein [Winogradskyella flava]|uniref:LysM peptidoglycan-binding domain-containing protein n=1 Tax=Winogradskyella flava TaxID=1884876 RepID=A0A842IVI3_9FLAO|nr:LysM peptidoglycan-binding domain-containing protein [Winogradskyella flava]MBC2846835.1 LysM peptidoglycan-binding domain-containing protein [Winogradskyella flava]